MDRLLTLRQAAAILSVSLTTMRRMVRVRESTVAHIVNAGMRAYS